jgi:DNA (cytosine-5)-methyltransferase 1
LEFFAGIGLARLGLEKAGFQVIWSNDREPAKKQLYDANFPPSGEHEFVLGDLRGISGASLPRGAALAWASSPCTDLSLAGDRAGLSGGESGAFWEYARVLEELGDDRPAVAVLENVVGLATSHGGEDLAAAVRSFNNLGYSVDVLSIDARRFVPQSRPRLFLVGVLDPPAAAARPAEETLPATAALPAEPAPPTDSDLPAEPTLSAETTLPAAAALPAEPALSAGGPPADAALRPDWLKPVFADPALRTRRLPLPAPPSLLRSGLGRCVEDLPAADGRWWEETRVNAFLASLSPLQRQRADQLTASAETAYRTAYRRTRAGRAVWEIRPDDIAGCLRTARGGSSKQALVRFGGGRLKVRWMTPGEYAALMGAGHYDFGAARTNQSLFGFGDAVAVPVVEWLARHCLRPLASGSGPAAGF